MAVDKFLRYSEIYVLCWGASIFFDIFEPSEEFKHLFPNVKTNLAIKTPATPPNLCWGLVKMATKSFFRLRFFPFIPRDPATMIAVRFPKQPPPRFTIQMTLLLRIHCLEQGHNTTPREEIATCFSEKRLQHDMDGSHKVCEVGGYMVPRKIPNSPRVIAAFIVETNVAIPCANHQPIVGDDKLCSGRQKNSQHESEQRRKERYGFGNWLCLHPHHLPMILATHPYQSRPQVAFMSTGSFLTAAV